MKNIQLLLLLAAALVLLPACTDETIGSSLIDTRSAIIEDSSFTITGNSVANHRLQARTATQLLGLINSDGYGTLSSQVVTEFMPSVMIDTTGVTVDMIDSCKLVLRIPSNGFTGDATTPMQLSVFRLNKPLPSPIFSDFDPSGYYSTSDLLGTAPYSPQSATVAHDARSTTSSATYLETYVPMPLALARELFTEFRNNPATFKSPKAFSAFFPGMFITNSFGSGRMMNFEQTEFKVYYRKHLTSFEGVDSIAEAQESIYMAASPEVLSDNILSLNVDPDVQSMINDGKAVVMAPAGYEVRIKFPIRDIIDHFEKHSETDLAVINTLTLTIPVEEMATSNGIAPPPHLLMVKTSKKDQFIAGDSLTNDRDSFYATYSKTDKNYEFTGLRAYVLDILDNQGGFADDDDIDFTITPVDVTTYTSTSYYSSSTATTVTKIAPMVSAPAITCLRLDKAKVKITYSKQLVM